METKKEEVKIESFTTFKPYKISSKICYTENKYICVFKMQLPFLPSS